MIWGTKFSLNRSQTPSETIPKTRSEKDRQQSRTLDPRDHPRTPPKEPKPTASEGKGDGASDQINKIIEKCPWMKEYFEARGRKRPRAGGGEIEGAPAASVPV